jgi:hypothetical protein
MRAESTPAELRCEWLLLLLAPIAWAFALPALLALNEDACARGDHSRLWWVAIACTVAALLPLPIAWWRSKRVADGHRAADRARFLLNLAMGTSAVFTLVLIVMAIPMSLLDPCRT